MYFHCFVKVCNVADEATCSKTTVTGAVNACSATAPGVPTRRRRDTSDADSAIDFNTPVVKVRVKRIHDENKSVVCQLGQ